jgi:hypothetical protein
MKHEIEEEIAHTHARILYPVIITLPLRTGVHSAYNQFVFSPGKGKAWTELAKAWKSYKDKEGMLAANGFMPGIKAKCVIVPVKKMPLETPTIDPVLLAAKLAAYGKKEGWGEVAVAKSHWLNMRFSVEQYQQLVDGLEQKGITAHEYE